jgi:hypothetical protein
MPLMWIAIAIALLAACGIAYRLLARVAMTRASVLDEVRRMLRGGTVQQTPQRGPQARGRLGQLEITVDLHHDPRRPKQSPMWRVLAVGPVRVDHAVEVRSGGWQGWIDPWMELAEPRTVAMRDGTRLEVHCERPLTIEHPVMMAVLRQSALLGAGSLYAGPDLMRAEVAFAPHARDNRALFAWLQTMAEISDSATGRTHRDGSNGLGRGARVRVFAPRQE